jgi:hypothetical protein
VDNKLRYSRRQAAEALGISLRLLDNRIATGALKAVRDGGRIFVTSAALKNYAGRDQAIATQENN